MHRTHHHWTFVSDLRLYPLNPPECELQVIAHVTFKYRNNAFAGIRRATVLPTPCATTSEAVMGPATPCRSASVSGMRSGLGRFAGCTAKSVTCPRLNTI